MEYVRVDDRRRGAARSQRQAEKPAGASAASREDVGSGWLNSSMPEPLTQAAEQIRVDSIAKLDAQTQSKLGQYFTPARAAELIASMPQLPESGVVRILDPGAGSGMLTAAIVERIAVERPQLAVHAVAVELDCNVFPALQETARLIERWAAETGLNVRVEARNDNFIERWTGFASLEHDPFDLVIMNPPYAKLAAKAAERSALRAHGWETPNLYAAFMALGVEALRPGGQLVAITPRSFANGPYFTGFRRRLLDELIINRLHTFESRSTVFSDTGVLQENIILSGTKGGEPRPVDITVSKHHKDMARAYAVDYADLVDPLDQHAFIRVVTNEEDTRVAERMVSLPETLETLGVKVSTGRVVDFRQRECLKEVATPETVPLVYPGNIASGEIVWPREIRKAQYFEPQTDKDARCLLPHGTYVLIKRFSAKEERRRIVAGVWGGTNAAGEAGVAFENHLNVIHCDNQGLDDELAWGLCLWLNSSLVDKFFRTFSGHTQVNASDLRSLPFPAESELRALARRAEVLPPQEDLDLLVDEVIQAGAFAA